LKNYIIIILIVIINQILIAQPIDENRKVIVKSYSINTTENIYNNQEIIISNNDSIVFFYGLTADNNAPKDPFLFRLVLKKGQDSSVFNTGQSLVSYKNLNEGEYELYISGFDLQRRWRSNSAIIKFEVNNKRKQLLIELDSLRNLSKQPNKKDTVIVNSQGIFHSSITIYVLIGLLILAIIILVIIIKKLDKFKKINQNKKGELMIDKNSFVTKDEFDRVLYENGELKAEIASLRGQIDALNARGEQLYKENKELQSNLLKLEKSKSELEELQRQKDDLFAVIIHDIKNPASLIKSLVELLTSYDLTATEQQEIINDIAQTTSKIVALSQEVSKILSLEGTKLNLNFDTANLNDIIKDVYQRNQIAAKNKSITMFTDLMEGLPDGEFDVQKIDEVIDNLVSNAIKFTPNGGTVRIKSSKELNNLVVEVSDNGLGLSEDDLKNTFKRGAKLSAQPTAGESSTGLGLWIVKKLVESHKGRVWVKSALGKGSTFAFSIPMSQED